MAAKSFISRLLQAYNGVWIRMLKIKFLTVLGITAVVANITNPVGAQSSRNIQGRGYTLSGDSLMGISERTANQDFPVFFNAQPSGTTLVNSTEQNTRNFRRTREQVQINSTPIYLEPGQEDVYGNDGLQVQFDLTNIDRRQDSK